MKRIVGLLLITVMLFASVISVVPVSAATNLGDDSNKLFYWSYNNSTYAKGNKNCAEKNRPEIDEAWMDSNSQVHFRFWGRKGQRDYGYRIFVRTPYTSWIRVSDMGVPTKRDSKSGLMYTNATLSWATLEELYNTPKVGDIANKKWGVYDSKAEAYYCPLIFTIRTLTEMKTYVGGFRGEKNEKGTYKSAPVQLKPYQGNRSLSSFKSTVANFSAPLLSSKHSDIWTTISENGKMSSYISAKKFRVYCPAPACGCIAYIRIYTQSDNGGWVKFKDLDFRNKDSMYEDFYVKLPRTESGVCLITARAFDKNNKWISGFRPYQVSTVYG